ncbi:MAG: PEP-CTERM sorting domain-containing protein [Verrucomicrobiota bacterium]
MKTSSKAYRAILGLVFILATVQSSHAILNLSINTTNKTLSFGTTSDTGTPTGPTGFLTAWDTDSPISGTGNDTVDVSSILLTDGTPTSISLITVTADTDNVALTVFEGSSNYSTIAGNGGSVSYAGLAPNLQAGLEAVAILDLDLFLIDGSGFSSVTTTLVPEPSTYALAFGGILFAAALMIRKKRPIM